MAWLQKKLTVTYCDREGRRVPRGTPGAKKISVESKKWFGCWKVGSRKVMIPLATDKDAALAMLADRVRQREKGDAGLIDPYKPHLDRGVADHLADYLAVLQSSTRSKGHHREVERVLTKLFAGAGIKLLRELTGDRVQRYIVGLKCGAATRNKCRTYAVSFCNYLIGANCIPGQPITKFSVRRAKAKESETPRTRRAIRVEEIRRLLDVIGEYPLKCAQVNKGGRKAKTNPQTRPAKLKPATVEKLVLRGRERRLLYRVALLTGLRRQEIERLRVKHLRLDGKPLATIDLPGNLTKNGKRALVPLVPGLADELRAWVAETGRKAGDKLLGVPSRSNLAKMHMAHLAAAGIEYRDDSGRYVDFHALRMCATVLLRHAGVPAKERQLFLRHSKLEITTETYDDAAMTATADVLRALSGAGI